MSSQKSVFVCLFVAGQRSIVLSVKALGTKAGGVPHPEVKWMNQLLLNKMELVYTTTKCLINETLFFLHVKLVNRAECLSSMKGPLLNAYVLWWKQSTGLSITGCISERAIITWIRWGVPTCFYYYYFIFLVEKLPIISYTSFRSGHVKDVKVMTSQLLNEWTFSKKRKKKEKK